MKRQTFCLSCLCLCSRLRVSSVDPLVAQTAPTKPLTIETLYQPGGLAGRGPETVEWSPDGTRLSFVQRDEKGEKGELWYVDAGDRREESAGQRGEAGLARSGREQGEERAGEGTAHALSRGGVPVGSGLEASDFRFAGTAVAVRPGESDGGAVYVGAAIRAAIRSSLPTAITWPMCENTICMCVR